MRLQFHIAYGNIDAVVEVYSTRSAPRRYYMTPEGTSVKHLRTLVFDGDKRPELLETTDNLVTSLLDNDDEIDIETTGREISRTTRIFVDDELKPIYSYKVFEVLTRPSGEKQERPFQPQIPNINENLPVKITEKLYSPLEVATKFLIMASFFVTHTDGVSYKFLYEIAESLAQSGKFARLQSFDPITKKPAPLVFTRGRRPFPAAFLEGRVKKDEYCLILHLSNQELKLPPSKTTSKEES